MRKTSILLASAVYLIGHTLAAAQQPYTPCDELSAFQKFVRGGCGDFKGNIGSGDGNGLFREAKDRENDKEEPVKPTDPVTSPGNGDDHEAPTDPGDGDDNGSEPGDGDDGNDDGDDGDGDTGGDDGDTGGDEDDGDHDNGHGNDDDHDDDSNPGQGGGHHGGKPDKDKPGKDKPGKGGGKGPGRDR